MLHRLILLGLLTAGLSRADVLKESYAEIHPLDPHGKVQVADVNGSIVIRTWDRAEVSVQVDKTAGDADELKAIRVEIESDPAALSVKTIFPKHEFTWRDLFDWSWTRSGGGQVQLTLTVPSAAELGRISTVNGSVTLEQTHGSVDAATVNGSIHASGLHGGTFRTVNGSIEAAVVQFDSDANLAATTVNGSVTLLLPRDVGAQVRASTVNGHISCGFPIAADEGMFRSSLAGVIGPGGGSIRASTVNGAVHLQSF